MKRRQTFSTLTAVAFAIAAGPFTAAPAAAQDKFPNGPIQLIVPFAPGGSVDVVARKIAERFKADVGEQAIVVNRPGANGVLAWQSLINSKPDGQNLFAPAGQGLGFVHLMNTKLPSKFLDDFKPVAAYANYPVVILVNTSLPVTSLKELAQYAVKNPKALNYGTTGVGSGGHFLFELYKSEAKVPEDALPAVHYAGIAPEMNALVGNHIQVAIMPLTSLTTQQIAAGKIRALAVSSDKRSPFSTEIPTVVEQGFPQLVAKDYLTYWVVANTPDSIVAKLAEVTRKATQDPEVRKVLDELYLETEFQNGAGARKQFDARAEQFSPLIEKLNLKLQ